MLSTGYQHPGPVAVRYPRGAGRGFHPGSDLDTIPIGKARKIREGKQVVFLNFGSMLEEVLSAAMTLDAAVIDMRFIKPLDSELLQSLIGQYTLWVTVEDHVVTGGAGSAVLEWLAISQHLQHCLLLGLPDVFTEHGTRDQILAEHGLTRHGILASIHAALQR